MDKTLKHWMLLVVLSTAGFACLAGLGLGLWCLLADMGPGALLVRGGLGLLAVLALAFVPGLILSSLIGRPVRRISDQLTAIGAGRLPEEFKDSSPAELAELSNELFKLAHALQDDRQEADRAAARRARDMRQEALKRFAEGIAREVQQPLAGVVGFAEMALRQEGIEGQLKNYLTLIEQEARSGRETLERVLRYCRDEAFATEPLDINQLVVETSHGLVSPNEGENVRLSMNLSQDLPRVLGDAGQLAQLFTSLLANAREALGADGGAIELSTNTDKSGRVVVMVKDAGRGMPAEQHDRVFTPFFTNKGTRKGAGLSLALADSIVRRHGGRIEFFSDPGQGTVFFVTLPSDGPTSE
jgi:signal transduction histidine kinase